MNVLAKTGIAVAIFFSFFISNIAEAGTGKCSSTKRPSPKSGACVGIKSCNHDQSKEDTFNVNSKVKKVAECIIKKTGKPMNMVSGYRCKRGSPGCDRGNLPYNGGADCSQHLKGNAIDASLPGVSLSKLKTHAFSCGASAAVAYPCYGFVHFDLGAKRSWATCGGNSQKAAQLRKVLERTSKRRG